MKIVGRAVSLGLRYGRRSRRWSSRSFVIGMVFGFRDIDNLSASSLITHAVGIFQNG